MSTLFLHSDIVRNIVQFLPDQGVSNALRVCKQWNKDLEDDGFWGSLIPNRGLPFVQDIHTEFKTVYRNLFRRTMSGEMFKKYYGEVRDIPLLSKKIYEQFIRAMDPFITAQKKMCETFWLMIDTWDLLASLHARLTRFKGKAVIFRSLWLLGALSKEKESKSSAAFSHHRGTRVCPGLRAEA